MTVKKKKKKETTINDLAIMIGKGFEHMDQRMDSMDQRMGSLEQGQEEIIKSNEREHNEIKTRLDNVAYRFELVELQKRVEILERRAG